jgi:multimeric flavodoxin WrbA
MEIKPCDACATCRGEGFPGCHIQDDMQEIYAAVEAADAVVVASPTYFHSVSAQTKLVLDRFFAMADEEGWTLRGKKFGVVMTYGNVDPYKSGAVNAFRAFQGVFGHIGAEGLGLVYGTGGAAGSIRENEKLMAEAFDLGGELAS